MKFGPVPAAEAAGAILAHRRKVGSRMLKKGRVLTAEDAAELAAAGVDSVIAARLEPDDVPEDEAARRIAERVTGDGLSVSAPFTGRVNLFAEAPGVAAVDPARLDAINLVDEAITVATLPPWTPVETGQMVATIKIIPFAAPGAAVEAVLEAAGNTPLVRIAPYRGLTAILIQTRLPDLKETILDKTVGITRARLSAVGGELLEEWRVPHEADAVAEGVAKAHQAGADLILVAGASAIVDRRDILPAGIELAGGTVEHFGMPVDPGNLLLLARMGGTPVLGLPGCARSPKLNGFDWVLQRIAAGIPVGRRDVMAMGSGGLLAEIPTRPQPRAEDGTPAAPRAPRIAALVLAAGRSTRMGANKMLAAVDGVPMVARTVDAVLASRARPVLVVTGHDADAVQAALAGRDVAFVHNPDYAGGLSTSLRAGIDALPKDADGVLVCLGDMPLVSASVLERLIAAFNPVEGRAICLPTAAGKRGNPILWSRRFFAEMRAVSGDVGARGLLTDHADQLVEVETGDQGILVDVDTPAALSAVNERRAVPA